MNQLPYEIKLTYVIALIIMLLFVSFIIIISVLYNKKQILLLKEKQLQEVEHEKELLQKELETQKALELERERISKDMHDDLGAGISSIKLQGEYILHHFDLNQEVKTEITELIDHTAHITASMREMIWSLKIQNDNLNSFINYIKNYTNSFLSKTTIKHSITTTIPEDVIILPNEIRRNLFLCIKEALNNTYKHSEASQIDISFSIENLQLQIVIIDNGKGIEEDKNLHSNGLLNMQDRLHEIKGVFAIKKSTKGTHLVFTCPI